MMREITGDHLGGSAAHVRIIDTREKAQHQQCFFAQLINLYQQLTERAPSRNIASLVSNDLHFIFIIQGTNLLASATLVLARTAIRCQGLIEEVVVDQAYRKAGLGKILIEEALRLGRARGCQYMQLTSKPERPGANMFYPKLGFELLAAAQDHPQGTNLYRCYL
mgnify:CR=1 FL=1